MSIILSIISIISFIILYFQKGVSRLIWYIGFTYFFHENIFIFGDYHKLLSILFILFVIKDYHRNLIGVLKIRYTVPIFLVFLLHILNAFYNTNISFSRALFLSISSFCVNFGVFIAAFLSLKNKEDIKRVEYRLSIFIVIISIVGIINFLLKENFILSLEGFKSLGESRGKISAFQISPNSHALSIILPLFLALHVIQSTKRKLVLIILVALNIFLSSHRAPIADFTLYLFIFLSLSPIFSNKKYQTYRIVFVSIILSLAAIYVLNSFRIISLGDKLNSIANAIQVDDVSKGDGSSIAMRLEQFDAAYYYYKKNPEWGEGIGYYNTFIQKTDYHNGLLGMESIVIWLLVEYGCILSFVIALLFFYCVYSFFKYRYKKKGVEYSNIAITILIVTIFHLLLNRPWGILEIMWPLIAICQKSIEIKNNIK